MLQCKDCEFCLRDNLGRVVLRCDPFSNIKEPECLQKWNLLKLDIMVRSYQSTLNFYQKLAPLQEKMLKHIEREIGDIEEADQWKYKADENDADEDDRDDLNL
ncbi:MAG: hypothetical protein GX629_10110 [Phycisphaerae bacterium]|jgi:hypothetical protein|nr:hypothetical protein [Phycisphaerae bacterium]